MMELEQLRGNPGFERHFKAALIGGHMSHAYLIEGPALGGKRTAARLLAAGMLCTGKEERPCGRCEHCRKVARNIHPDLIEITPQEGKKSISVEAIRSLRAGIAQLPNEAAVRVYLIAHADQLTVAAQNALLKSLEEPPSFCRFILTATSEESLLPVILSRVTVMRVLPVEDGLIRAELARRLPDLSAEQIDAACAMAQGSLGLALQGAQQSDLTQLHAFCRSFFQLLCGRDQSAFLQLTNELETYKQQAEQAASLLCCWLRDCLACQAGSDTLVFHGERQTILAVARQYSAARLGGVLRAVRRYQVGMRQYANAALAATALLTACWEETH